VFGPGCADERPSDVAALAPPSVMLNSFQHPCLTDRARLDAASMSPPLRHGSGNKFRTTGACGPGCADDPASDLAAIGDEEGLDQSHPFFSRKMEKSTNTKPIHSALADCGLNMFNAITIAKN
jgi:hypothetical protein